MAINVLLHKGINCRENNDSHTILIIKNRVRNVFILYYERKKRQISTKNFIHVFSFFLYITPKKIQKGIFTMTI